MPRSDTIPEAAPSARRLHLWRHNRKPAGQDSLDSDDGLGELPVSLGASPVSRVAPAGKAASHESGSLSDLEDGSLLSENTPQPSPSLSFGKFRLGGKRDKSLPPQPVTLKKSSSVKVEGVKSKSPRVNRLREFTERLRKTDLRWSREDKSVPISSAAGSHPPGSFREAHPSVYTSHSISIRPQQQTRIGDTKSSGKGGSFDDPIYRTSRPEHSISLRERPASDSELTWESLPVSVASTSPVSTASASPTMTASTSPISSSPVTGAGVTPHTTPRTVAFRSASFTKLNSYGKDSFAGASRNPVSVRPVSYGTSRGPRSADCNQSVPRKFDANARQVRETTEEVETDDDMLKTCGSLAPPKAYSPMKETDAHTQQENNLLEAMLREIQLQSLSLQEQDTDAWLNRKGRQLLPEKDLESGYAGKHTPYSSERGGENSVSVSNAEGTGANRTATAQSVSLKEECPMGTPATAVPAACVEPICRGGDSCSRPFDTSADDATYLASPETNEAVTGDVTAEIGSAASIQGHEISQKTDIGVNDVPVSFRNETHEQDAAKSSSNDKKAVGAGQGKACQQPTESHADLDTISVDITDNKNSTETNTVLLMNTEQSATCSDSLEPKFADLSPVITVHSRLIEPHSRALQREGDAADSIQIDDASNRRHLFGSTGIKQFGFSSEQHSRSLTGEAAEYASVNRKMLNASEGIPRCLDELPRETMVSSSSPNICAPATEARQTGVLGKQTEPIAVSQQMTDVFRRLTKSSQSDPSSEFSERQDSSDHSPVSSTARSGTPQLVRQNATTLDDPSQATVSFTNNVRRCEQRETSRDMSDLDEECLKLDMADKVVNFQSCDDQENIRQAVKKAVQLLLTELNVDEDQEDPWYPSANTISRTPSRSRDEPESAGELVRKCSSSRQPSLTPHKQPESKTVDVVRIPDHNVAPPPPDTESQPTTPAISHRRFRSRSLSPELPNDRVGGNRSAISATERASESRRLRRFQHMQHRSIDWASQDEKHDRKRSLKQRKNTTSKSTKPDSVKGESNSSSSSEDLESVIRPTASRSDQGGRGRGRGHGQRNRTVSDSATLKPPVLVPLAEQAALTATVPVRRDASPSVAYDSDADGGPRGARRRLRGPYGELLEGKMTRGAENLTVASISGLTSVSESPRSSGGRETVGTPSRRRSRLMATSGSEGELADPPQEMLNDVLYDGVGPTAASLMSQLSSQRDHLTDAKQNRRLFIIGELLDTEQLYVESLRLLVDYFQKLRSPELGSLVDPNALLDIFHMVPEILDIHEHFLADLNSRTENWTADQLIGEVFINKLTHGAVLETYTAFVNNWPNAREALLRSCQARPELGKFLEALERSNKRKLSLTHLLIMPVQRVPRYELLLKQLVSHTSPEHPDYEPLREACLQIHQLAARINGLQRATMREEAAQQLLRDIEGAVDGLDGLVSADRYFVRHDIVSIVTPAGVKKERCLFVFNDLLVIASVKRRPGSTGRKPATSVHLSTSSVIEPNKYKFLMKVPISDVSVDRESAEDPDVLLKEVERIDDDISTLRHMGVLVCKLHSNHHQVEELVREMAHVLNRELTERHRLDSQLLLLPLQIVTEDGTDNITVSFYDTEKRLSWERLLAETKEKLVSGTLERRAVPRFLYPIPVRKTRAGLQFTCAAPTMELAGSSERGRDVWVCNSDGYVGQICTLSLHPEPAVTSCNGVCNSRILCITPVPGASRRSHISGHGQEPPVTPSRDQRRSAPPEESRRRSPASSPESDSDLEPTTPHFEALPSSANLIQQQRRLHQTPREDGMSRHSLAEEPKLSPHQATMWLGTEDGCIYVYNCSDYVRVKKTTVKVHLGAAVSSMAHMEGKVFAALSSGAVAVFSRSAAGVWDMQSPVLVQTSAHPVNKLACVLGRLWACTQNVVKIIHPSNNQIQETVCVGGGTGAVVRCLVHSGLGVWLSFEHSASVRLFHAASFELACEIDVTSSVARMLTGCDDIIRQHKTACLRITSLMVCRGLLWIGTSAGVILNLPIPRLDSNTSWISNTLSIAGISHGHTGHVRFLACAEAGSEPGTQHAANRNSTKSQQTDSALVISGGDGFEDFRSSGVEFSGREDATNHLLLWSVS